MSDDTPEDEFTELVDPNITRMDAVGKAANGTTILMAKSAEGEPAGLFDPEFVRELVAKAEAEPAAQTPDAGTVTVTGRPESIAAVMRQMHQAAVMSAEVQKAAAEWSEYVAFAKAKYSADKMRALGAKGHAMSTGDGEYDYPIDDAEDLGRAIHAVGRGGADHDKIRAYIIRRARAMGMSDQIPDGWSSDGSPKQAAMAKADGSASDPGSPAWEAQDADTADGLVQAILALHPRVKALAQREGAEYGAGDMGDIGDVYDLQSACDWLMQAAKTIGGVAVAERAEAAAASVAKADAAPGPTPLPAAAAAPSPQESTVSDTQGGAAATTETTAAATDVAKGGETLTEAQLAELGRQFLAKAAKKAAKKAATQTTGAAPAPTDARVIPGTDTVQSPAEGADGVAKAAAQAAATALAEVMAPVAKQLAELAAKAEDQQARVEKAMAKPDDRRSPMLNGATGIPGLAPSHRGTGFQDRPEFEPVLKALAALPDGPEKEQAQTDVAVYAIAGRLGHSVEDIRAVDDVRTRFSR
jgi:hypothetical protein